MNQQRRNGQQGRKQQTFPPVKPSAQQPRQQRHRQHSGQQGQKTHLPHRQPNAVGQPAEQQRQRNAVVGVPERQKYVLVAGHHQLVDSVPRSEERRVGKE